MIKKKKYNVDNEWIDLLNIHTGDLQKCYKISGINKIGQKMRLHGIKNTFDYTTYIIVDIVKYKNKNVQITYGDLERIR